MPGPSPEPQFTVRKQVAFAAALFFGFFLLLEIGSRAVHAAWTGDAYGLVYGLPPALNRYATYYEGYFKYHPGRTLHQMDHDPPIAIRINSRGFRGPDFEPEKAPGVFRIVALGGSSTYGYHSRDDHTYPAILQRLLDGRWEGRYEVLNLGLPLYTSSNIVALMRGEVAGYAPDLVTLYEGYNDTFEMRKARKDLPLIGIAKWVHRKSFFLHLAGAPLKGLYERYLGSEVKERVAAQFLLDEAKLREIIESTSAVYRANLEELVRMSREHGFALLFIRQPMTTRFFVQTRIREPLPYAEELARIERALEAEGGIWRDEASIVVHSRLMQVLEEVAGRHGIPIVDGTAHTDLHPEHMVSWVHLSEEGNQALATRIFEDYFAAREARAAADGAARP
jgi:lysophospholipase L1-like esterase